MCDEEIPRLVPRRFTVLAVYGGNHGSCIPDNGQYVMAEAERALAALITLYGTALV